MQVRFLVWFLPFMNRNRLAAVVGATGDVGVETLRDFPRGVVDRPRDTA